MIVWARPHVMAARAQAAIQEEVGYEGTHLGDLNFLKFMMVNTTEQRNW